MHNRSLSEWCAERDFDAHRDLVRLDFIIIAIKIVSFSNIKIEQTASPALFFMRRI